MKYLAFYLAVLASVPASTAYPQTASDVNQTVVAITLSEGREVEKSFIQANVLASVKGPNLDRLNTDLDNSLSGFKATTFKSPDTSIIFGHRNASVASKLSLPSVGGVALSTAGLFWALQQQVIIQGTDQDEVLSFIKVPVPGIEISSINYSVPIALQKKTEVAVTELALKEVIARADLVMKSLQGTSVRIADIRVSTRTQSPGAKDQPPSTGGNEERSIGDVTNMPTPTIASPAPSESPQADQPTLPTTVLVTADVVANLVVSK